MKREDRRRKFHESLINMLHPPPPIPQEDKEEPLTELRESFNANHFTGDELEDTSSSSSSNDEDESGAQKLTRAQRKRLRRKRLKQSASRRRKIIGPLLPSTASDDTNCDGDSSHVMSEGQEGVRRNAAEGIESVIDNVGKTSASTNQNKLKQRRLAKRLGREDLKKSSSGNTNHQPSSANEDSIRTSEAVDPN